jgi:hypothetical protein
MRPENNIAKVTNLSPTLTLNSLMSNQVDDNSKLTKENIYCAYQNELIHKSNMKPVLYCYF